VTKRKVGWEGVKKLTFKKKAVSMRGIIAAGGNHCEKKRCWEKKTTEKRLIQEREIRIKLVKSGREPIQMSNGEERQKSRTSGGGDARSLGWGESLYRVHEKGQKLMGEIDGNTKQQR